jgi:L-amino acid N-acyltransferase
MGAHDDGAGRHRRDPADQLSEGAALALALRDATAADVDAINAIYNHYVATSTCTYDRDPRPAEAAAAWFAAHGPAHPVTIAEVGGAIVGWGSLSPFRPRWGYRFTVEDTVYVRHDHHGRGVGRAVLADLVARARALGHRVVIAAISADQTASVRLHEALGFAEAGRLHGVGDKLDRRLDLALFQLALA